jgi:dihydroorotase
MISMSRLVELCVKNPSDAIGEKCGAIKVGERASVMLFDPSKSVTIDEKLSLYCGEELYGEVKAIF